MLPWESKKMSSDKSMRLTSKLYGCFVEFKKAYDSVWREGMFIKLRKLGRWQVLRSYRVKHSLETRFKRTFFKQIDAAQGKSKRTPADQRFCRHCINKVEDEVYFIAECPLYKHSRTELLRACPEVEQLHQRGQTLFVFLFTSTNENVIHVI